MVGRGLVVARAAAGLAVVALVVSAVAGSAVPAGAEAPAYIPPVGPPQAVLTGHFRPPPTPYAAGDRGVDWATAPGTPVLASAGGKVLFAGPVADTLAVTIGHPDGLRTSYSFLASVLVAAGDEVVQGQTIATTATTLHFGVRDPTGRYLDPERLFAGRLGAHLVPGVDDGASPLGADRWGVFDPAGEAEALVSVVAEHIAAGGDPHLAALAHELIATSLPVSLLSLASEVQDWRRSQVGCTPQSVHPVAPPRGSRLVVLVAGLGSNDRTASIDQVDVASLGYDPGDVIRFSYRGGRAAGRPVPPASAAAAIPATSYGSADTQGDLRVVAGRLRALLARLAGEHPGVPIDVIAHSQGGVVVHLALAAGARSGSLPTDLGVVVTIASPHQGTDLATALQALRGRPLGELTARTASASGITDLEPDSVGLAQLSETSTVADEMRRPLPSGVHLLSIGAAGDPVVPWVRTVTPGASSALIAAGGWNAHSDLPASPAVTREIALALAGRSPTCQDLLHGLGLVVLSHLVAGAEDQAGAGLTAAALGPSPP
jgi:hypothetical protein